MKTSVYISAFSVTKSRAIEYSMARLFLTNPERQRRVKYESHQTHTAPIAY